MSFFTDDTPTQWFSPSQRKPGTKVSAISLRLRESTRPGGSPEEKTVPGKASSNDPRREQQMLWVDSLGGYLVTLADEVTIGLPASAGGDAPDLAILADLSRRHARLARTGGSYVLTPYGPTTVAGKPIDGPTVLEDGARFSLGEVEFALRRPHALSSSAVLTVESGHRTVPAADAVLLMAESCVLGSKPHSHLRNLAWRDEAILFRGAEGLLCRSNGPLAADGQRADGPVRLSPGTRVEGQDFTLCVEEVMRDEA